MFSITLTQLELSHIVGIHNRILQQYENGERNPKQDRLTAITNALGVNPEVLIAPKNIAGGDMHAFIRAFRKHKGKFDEHGNLVFKDSFADEIYL